MPRIHSKDLVLQPSAHIDPAKWDENKYDSFVDELCAGREYQKTAIFAVLRFLLGGNYANLRELARENFDANAQLQEYYGSWGAMEGRLQLPDMLSCSVDLATGTGKSYILYGLAAIMLAEGAVDRVLVLCPSLTIESGLTEKFRALAADANLREAMPEDARLDAPSIIDASQTVTDGCICVENYHAVLKRVKSSIRDSFAGRGERTLVLNDEAHHVAAQAGENKKWKEFLQDPDFGFRRVVGVSGTCYTGNDYFADVISRYSLREAIEGRVVKNVEYVAESPRTNDPDEKWQLIHQRHKKSRRTLKSGGIRPLTIVVTGKINACENVAEELRTFLRTEEGITEAQAKEKVLIVTSSPMHRRNVLLLSQVDNPRSKVEWIISVSMLSEGWDVKNVFQIVPHEERAFNSKLLIAQVLGRGLRVPESWVGEPPVVTVFNHDSWAARIKHLVDEILDVELRLSSLVIPDSSLHFDLHHLEYERDPDERDYKMRGPYNIFGEGFVALPTVAAEESGTVSYQTVRGKERQEAVTIRHKSFIVDEIVEDMWRKLEAVDRETATESDPQKRTNYAVKYPRKKLEKIVRESIRRSNNDPDDIPDELRQIFLKSLSVLHRRISKRVTYSTEAKRLLPMNTCERQADSCSAAELRGNKTIFYRSDCVNYLPQEQVDFFNKVADPDGDFAGNVEKMTNDYLFKSPVNLAIADHKPERRFIRRLCERKNADKIAGWIKNTDTGFYAVEYAWSKARSRRVAHIKRGMFSPDFFVKTENNCIYVVEIKDDSEVGEPSRENIAKHKFATAHFKLLNEWLGKESESARYQFNMLTPRDYDAFFMHLRESSLDGYQSHLDAAIVEKGREEENGG